MTTTSWVPPPPPTRRWAGIALGSVTTLVAVLVLGLLAVRVVDGVRDVGAPAGSARAQERDARRAAVDDAALVRATGVPLEQLRAMPGVVLTHDPGASVDCVDSCSAAELAVTGAAAERGPLARERLLARLQARGYAETVRDGIGCRPLDPARACRLQGPDGASVTLLAGAGSDYVLQVDGG